MREAQPRYRAWRRGLASTFIAVLFLPAALTATPQTQEPVKPVKSRYPHWDPPQVDARFRSHDGSPPCPVRALLGQAATRADELIENLQNFTAQEKIEFRLMDMADKTLASGAGKFDYTVAFESSPQGLVVQENRVAEAGSHEFPASSQDAGLPVLALLFRTEFQGDYEMKCEGAAERDGQAAWLIHFQQRKDKPSRTVSFGDKGRVFPAKLKGRAWIAQDSGEVLRLEAALEEGIPVLGVQQWYLAIDYAPVQFRTQNVRVWLPQSAEAYCDFGQRRSIIYHTFADFLLFSVQTDQVIEKPREN